MKALILVGLQIDLGPGGAVGVPESGGLVPVINRLMPRFDLVVAANFWLPAGHRLFAANHLWRKPGQALDFDGYPAILQTMFCVQNSFGAEFMAGLNTEQISFAATMGTGPGAFPHSAFFDAGDKRPTGLESFLKNQKATQVYIAGMPLEKEVKNTALDAMGLGCPTFLFSDACKPRLESEKQKTLDLLAGNGVQLLPSTSF